MLSIRRNSRPLPASQQAKGYNHLVLGVARQGRLALRIPPDVPHSVEALEDSVAVDLFSPRREDWIRGDDAYLRK